MNRWPPPQTPCPGCGQRVALDGHARTCPWLAEVRDRRAERAKPVRPLFDQDGYFQALRELVTR